jgi:FkbM family methyltransferase
MGHLRDLYRRLRVAWHKPRHWQLRPGTFDGRIYREVMLDNEYDLPPRFGPEDVILDVGGHIGTFAHAVLQRGAALVCCCEPEADNFRLLGHNLAPYGARVRLHRCAVWRSDVRVTSLWLHNPLRADNTGGSQVTGAPGGQSVPAVAFDDLVRSLTAGGRRIRLLKMDCEGAEWPILLTARTLDRIDAICGEYHLADFPEAFQVAGQAEFSLDVLQRHLRGAGFHVRIGPANRSSRPIIGHFFAQRRDVGRQAA